MIFFQSCSKDEGSISDTDLALAQDEAYADALYDEVDNITGTEISTLDENNYSPENLKSTGDWICATITVDHPDLITFPKHITIDYGEGCSVVFNGDTITRTGKILVTLSDRWYVEGATQTVTFENFTFNGVKVEGTRILTNLGLNAKNHFELGVVLQNGKLTFNDTAWMSRECNQVREWALHLNPLNDSIIVSGTASGTNILGEDYERVITDPIVFGRCTQYTYQWGVLSGAVQVSNSERGTFTIEHSGDGCSSEVNITKNGHTYNYTFKYIYNYRKSKNGN